MKYPSPETMMKRLSAITKIPCVVRGSDPAHDPALRAVWNQHRARFVSLETGEPVTCYALHDVGIALHVGGESGIHAMVTDGGSPKDVATAVWAWERVQSAILRATEG